MHDSTLHGLAGTWRISTCVHMSPHPGATSVAQEYPKDNRYEKLQWLSCSDGTVQASPVAACSLSSPRTVRRPTTPGRPLPAQDVNKPHRRSADRSLLVSWLNIQSLTNKTDDVQAVISERSLDILALTETWHSASDGVRLRLATPDDYAVVEAARSTGRGGGVAVICRKHFRCSRIRCRRVPHWRPFARV